MPSARLLAFVLLPVLAARAGAGALDELTAAAGPDAVSAAPVVAGAPAARFTQRRVIKVLSYNIKAHPAAFLDGFDGSRYAVIGRSLAARREAGTQPDLVLLQESFTLRARELRRAAGYPHQVRGPREREATRTPSYGPRAGPGGGARGGTLLSGGLYILSDHPVLASRVMTFAPRDCRSWDCWANKGAVMARIQLPGVPFPLEVYTTHMQSGPTRKADALRERQIDAVLDSLLPAERDPAVPLIFAGDFNTRPDRASYGRFVARAGLDNAGEDCLADPGACHVAEGTDPLALFERTVDQHFYAAGGPGFYRLRPIYAERSYPLDEELSDHLAYEVHYELSW
ncbi:MAG: endonuclease/exonuclease/phosphatase family protein [Elusimicrobiota bacterium]|nr:endonuclease/exonuclease/phosphatase family protein [Elusimicrobiota bacterium]